MDAPYQHLAHMDPRPFISGGSNSPSDVDPFAWILSRENDLYHHATMVSPLLTLENEHNDA